MEKDRENKTKRKKEQRDQEAEGGERDTLREKNERGRDKL